MIPQKKEVGDGTGGEGGFDTSMRGSEIYDNLSTQALEIQQIIFISWDENNSRLFILEKDLSYMSKRS